MVPTQGVADRGAEDRAGQEHVPRRSRTRSTAPDPDYDYGTHFLYQGHEAAASVTARAGLHHAHQPRRRRRAPRDAARDAGLERPADRHDRRLDLGPVGPAAALHDRERERADLRGDRRTSRRRSTDVSGALGRGGYEGIQNDSDGNIWIVEDIGGANKAGHDGQAARTASSTATSPASPGDLAHGKLQVLQVLNDATASRSRSSRRRRCNAPDQVALHTYGNVVRHALGDDPRHGRRRHTRRSTPTRSPRRPNATPFKRPENGLFRPGSHFREFFFDETGDTNATSPENADAGGWGVDLQAAASAARRPTPARCRSSTSATGRTPASTTSRSSRATLITFVEDAGDTLHGQRNALDSGCVFDVTADYSDPVEPAASAGSPRAATPSATIDAADGGFGKNDGDNEITGIHVSDGDPSAKGILGAKSPDLARTSSGAGSTPSSTATTSRTRSSRLPKRSAPHQGEGPASRALVSRFQVGGEVGSSPGLSHRPAPTSGRA